MLTYLEVEVKQHYHLSIGGLEEGMLHVIVEQVHFVSLEGGVTEAVNMSLKGSLK